MPLYEYQCGACGHRFELIQRFADPPADRCASCGQGPVRKLLSAPAVHFKGSGWYVTDYANQKSDGTAKPAGPRESDAPPKSDAASSGAKEPAGPPAPAGEAKPSATASTSAGTPGTPRPDPPA